ncbi:hypothetical protein ILUMI_14091 [Ignelater luminosus]|uniref:CCHC-type domain-containing protein n=1 Tax=Ignelater luminosus TaxID=2038154 RepID=A0A8K0CVG4_IGNLU|nr:hypothetical protein ILUMI_14091 [Ignelater luminosus]
MAGGEKRYYIPSFDGNNFDNWKFRLRVLLEEKNCLECLDGMDSSCNIIDSDDTATKAVKTKQIQDFLKKDRKCKSIITQTVADSHLENQLLQLKLEERGTFLTFDSIVRSLKASGTTLEENDIICHLLLTLPKSYEMAIKTIETIRGSDLILDFVKGKLLDEEIKQKSKSNMVQENFTAFAGKSNYNKKKWNTSGQKRYTKMTNKSVNNERYFRFKCHNCGQEGHKRAECRRKEHTHNIIL